MDDSRCMVRFLVGGADHVESEGMWAEKTPTGTYLVKNIPFFAYGVAYHDEVVARWAQDGRLWSLGVVCDSGNVTLRAAATARDAARAEEAVAALGRDLRGLGIGYEAAPSHHLLAITVSEIDDILGLLGVLEQFEAQGLGRWEEAKYVPWWHVAHR